MYAFENNVHLLDLLLFDQHDVPVPDDHRMNDWYGFKFVGDNVDGRVTPSFQRAEIRGHDMHYFHGCGVRDRVDLSAFSDKPPPYSTPDANVILPSSEDVEALQKELGILVSR